MLSLTPSPPINWVAFVEGKLRDIHKVRKIVPASKDLDNAYRLFKRGVAIRDLVNIEIRKHTKLRVPNDLAQRVRTYLDTHAEVPWDTAVAIIAGWQTE